MMQRRYEAYKTHVVNPFFRDHFSRLDRQIVLVDALTALNSGPAALRDLENALTEVMRAFRAGRASSFASIFRPRVDRILFAATKADHLHHASHDRLEAILRVLTGRAIARAKGVGAEIDVIALAAVRATREAIIRHDGQELEAIIGMPERGERIDDQVFDGAAEAAVFPGQLPDDPERLFEGDALGLAEADNDVRFVRFRPPVFARGAAAAAYPARPRATIPDGGPPRMSDRPRPRAFRLDDENVALEDVRAPVRRRPKCGWRPRRSRSRRARPQSTKASGKSRRRSGPELQSPGGRRSARWPGRVLGASFRLA